MFKMYTKSKASSSWFKITNANLDIIQCVFIFCSTHKYNVWMDTGYLDSGVYCYAMHFHLISDCKKYETIIIIPSGYLNAFGFQISEEKPNIVIFSLFIFFVDESRVSFLIKCKFVISL